MRSTLFPAEVRLSPETDEEARLQGLRAIQHGRSSIMTDIYNHIDKLPEIE